VTISAGGPFHTGGAVGSSPGYDRSIEAEEDCTEVGFGPFVGIWLELRLDVDDEGGADRGEQTGLRTWSTLYSNEGNLETHENQGGVEVLIVFCMYSVSYSVVSRLYMV
jgi:hypothetical protein